MSQPTTILVHEDRSIENPEKKLTDLESDCVGLVRAAGRRRRSDEFGEGGDARHFTGPAQNPIKNERRGLSEAI